MEADNKVAYGDILALNTTPTLMTNKGLEVPVLVKLFTFKAEVKSGVDAFYDLQKVIMEKYEIEEVNGSYNFKDHPQFKEISKELNQLLAEKVALTNLNFVPVKQFIVATEGKDIDQLAYMAKYLLEK